ncbi:transcriptional regulator MntR [Paenibacillus senegalensis]|uniref:transcriptional regulator MntR n=1 Tax=Paenibacillus senegalensis TaxID=1465766 RepID=UPI00028875D6|nr:transcriptional regulator MntR [Paenibacillus senegalensis]
MPTPGMEDHLEQIFILSRHRGYTRVSDVAEALSVKASSVSRMVSKLRDSGYVDYKRYGRVSLTRSGWQIGWRLLYRHEFLEKFLRLLGVQEDKIQAEVEVIEHHISWETLSRLEALMRTVEQDAELQVQLEKQLQQIQQQADGPA